MSVFDSASARSKQVRTGPVIVPVCVRCGPLGAGDIARNAVTEFNEIFAKIQLFSVRIGWTLHLLNNYGKKKTLKRVNGYLNEVIVILNRIL